MAPKKAPTHPCFACNAPATQQDLGDKNYYCNACFEKWEASTAAPVKKAPAAAAPRKAAAAAPAAPAAPVAQPTPAVRPTCVVCSKVAKRDPHTDGQYYCGPHLAEVIANPPPAKGRGRKAAAPVAVAPVAVPQAVPPRPAQPAKQTKQAPVAVAAAPAPARNAPAKAPVAAKAAPVAVAPAAPVTAPVKCVVCQRVARDAQIDRASVFCGRCFEATAELRAPRAKKPAPPVDPSVDRVKALEDQVARLQKQVRNQAPQPQAPVAPSQNSRPKTAPAAPAAPAATAGKRARPEPVVAAPVAAPAQPAGGRRRPQTAAAVQPAPVVAATGSPARRGRGNNNTGPLPEVRW